MEIIGKYKVGKMSFVVDGKLEMLDPDEVLKRVTEDPDEDEDSVAEYRMLADTTYEIKDDHTIVEWTPIPEGVTKEEIDEAVREGELIAANDVCFVKTEPWTWKEEDGKYYYDTRGEREILGEKQSPWDELVPDEEGLIPFANGFVKLKKID